MTKFQNADLDDYSRAAVPLILSRFPGWWPFSKATPRSDGLGDTIDFNVPCPSPAAEYGLWVSTADEELLVGFHTHHQHFTDYENRTSRVQIETGLQLAADIIEERTGVVSWYRGKTFAGSRSVGLPCLAPLPGLFDGLGASLEITDIFSNCDRVTLRSWLGTFDREEVRG